ncbi:MAG: PEGA domain-containing protein, partial [Myxococcota bacterium]
VRIEGTLAGAHLMGILTKHLYEEPTPPRQKVESIPEDLEAVILKAMAKQLDQRYQSMAELLEDLERVEAGVGTVAQETTRSFALETSESVAAPAESSGGGKGLLIAVVVLLIGGGVGGFFAFGGDGDPPVVANSPEVEPTPEPEPQPEPEVQPDPEPAGVEAPAAPETFTLTTEPVGAEVWLDGAFIGNTPIDVPKPSGSDRVNLEVKKPGFQDRALVVTSLSQDATLTLEAVRRPSSMRRPRMTEMATMMDAPAAMVEMVTMRNRPSPGSEVLNPWGD